MREHPTVTIGLPVYNGETFVGDAIESVLAQSFQDWELIVSDNASTDRTVEIARGFARRDPRVRCVAHEENRGASWNFNFTLQQARGEFVQWLSHDDTLEPAFLERCVTVLREDPTVVLAHTRVRIIDDDGEAVGDMASAFDRGDADTPAARFRQVLLADRWCYEVFGLVRREVMLETPGLAPHIASDRSLLAELALRGRFRQVPEYLFCNRDHEGRSIRALPAHHMRGEWFDPKLASRRVLPHWRICGEYLRCLGRVRLPWTQAMRCRLTVARWMAIDMNWARMGADLVLAVWPGAWRALDKISGSSRRWLGVQTD